MGNSKLTRLLLQGISRRKCHSVAKGTTPAEVNAGVIHDIDIPSPNWRASLKEKLKTKVPGESGSVCIYRVPMNMRQVETRAYDPNIISIGPYHHGLPRLQPMEDLKWQYFHRLLDSSKKNGVKIETMVDAMEELEQEARSCYLDDFNLGSSKLVEIMLVDGCFILELFKELMQHDFKHGSASIKRWMLPLLRRDLIMLENQLPISVLCKLFHLTNSGNSITSTTSLQELALRFFNPLMCRDPNTLVQSMSAIQEIKGRHFLDLFRSSILPRTATRGKETHRIRSITELKEAGVKIKIGENSRPLEISFKRRVLKIPPLHIDDYRGTLVRNMVAYEQCHKDCKPDITTYMFFFDGLINSADDVELLHYKGIIHHSLGSNKVVANLVNNLCKEVARDRDESYLHTVVCNVEYYISSPFSRLRARLVHNYFSNWVVGISTIAAFLALYLTLIQTGCGVADAQDSLQNESFLSYLKDSFLLPFYSLSCSKKDIIDHGDESKK